MMLTSDPGCLSDYELEQARLKMCVQGEISAPTPDLSAPLACVPRGSLPVTGHTITPHRQFLTVGRYISRGRSPIISSRAQRDNIATQQRQRVDITLKTGRWRSRTLVKYTDELRRRQEVASKRNRNLFAALAREDARLAMTTLQRETSARELEAAKLQAARRLGAAHPSWRLGTLERRNAELRSGAVMAAEDRRLALDEQLLAQKRLEMVVDIKRMVRVVGPSAPL